MNAKEMEAFPEGGIGRRVAQDGRRGESERGRKADGRFARPGEFILEGEVGRTPARREKWAGS
jgi:hypothetical protein